ncbi:MAG: hypothetical protein HZA29_02135 [Candidatus Omnitrophica bacterium]|nr:hypothetical protein [Candidatus Omnitrophota bacterium]
MSIVRGRKTRNDHRSKMRIKKFRCTIVREDGTQEARVLEAPNRGALKKKLKEEGLAFKAVREEFSIKGSLALFLIFCFFIVPFAPVFDVSFMSMQVLFFVGVCWVISLLTRDPRKAVAPAIVTLALLLCTVRINVRFADGMKRMVPEGDTIVRALEDYHRQYGDYPRELDQLVPRFLDEVPQEPFHYAYFYRSQKSCGLVAGVPPFDVIYDDALKLWRPRYPT